MYEGEGGIAVAPLISESSKDVIFSVMINDEKFVATKVKTEVVEDRINIVGTDEERNESVFLTFKKDKNGTMILGRTIENKDNTIAGYLFNSGKSGYVTSEMYSACGTITTTEINTSGQTISGEFQFDACNSVNDVMTFTAGTFSNIPWEK